MRALAPTWRMLSTLAVSPNTHFPSLCNSSELSLGYLVLLYSQSMCIFPFVLGSETYMWPNLSNQIEFQELSKKQSCPISSHPPRLGAVRLWGRGCCTPLAATTAEAVWERTHPRRGKVKSRRPKTTVHSDIFGAFAISWTWPGLFSSRSQSIAFFLKPVWDGLSVTWNWKRCSLSRDIN